MTDLAHKVLVRLGRAAPKLVPLPRAVWEAEYSPEDIMQIYWGGDSGGGTGSDALYEDEFYKTGLAERETHKVPLPKPGRVFEYHPPRLTADQQELVKIADLARTLGLKPKVSRKLTELARSHPGLASFDEKGKLVKAGAA